jgi:hypothetical protein
MFKIIQQRLVEQIKEGALLKEKLQQSIKKLKFKLKELTKELKNYLKQFFKSNLGHKSYINKLENLLNFYKKDLKRLRAEYHVRFAKKKKQSFLFLKKEKFQKKKKLKTLKSCLKNFKENFVICCQNIENVFLLYVKKFYSKRFRRSCFFTKKARLLKNRP